MERKDKPGIPTVDEFARDGQEAIILKEILSRRVDLDDVEDME